MLSKNTPCPCGSGRKYKRCCYLNEELKQVKLDCSYKDRLVLKKNVSLKRNSSYTFEEIKKNLEEIYSKSWDHYSCDMLLLDNYDDLAPLRKERLHNDFLNPQKGLFSFSDNWMHISTFGEIHEKEFLENPTEANLDIGYHFVAFENMQKFSLFMRHIYHRYSQRDKFDKLYIYEANLSKEVFLPVYEGSFHLSSLFDTYTNGSSDQMVSQLLLWDVESIVIKITESMVINSLPLTETMTVALNEALLKARESIYYLMKSGIDINDSDAYRIQKSKDNTLVQNLLGDLGFSSIIYQNLGEQTILPNNEIILPKCVSTFKAKQSLELVKVVPSSSFMG